MMFREEKIKRNVKKTRQGAGRGTKKHKQTKNTEKISILIR